MPRKKKPSHLTPYAKIGDRIVRSDDIDAACNDAEDRTRARRILSLIERIARLVEYAEVDEAVCALTNVLIKVTLESADSGRDLQHKVSFIIDEFGRGIVDNLEMGQPLSATDTTH
jgi:hypothetical protein